jgi:2-aminomuconate deaminase
VRAWVENDVPCADGPVHNKSDVMNNNAGNAGKAVGSSSDGALRSERAAEPVGPYPHSRKVGGLLFISGMGPRKRGTKVIPGLTLDAAGNVVSYDIEAEMRSTFENVRIVLEENGAAWDCIVDCLVFLTDMQRDWSTYNRVYGEFFPPGPHQPCRTTVEISRLPQGGDGPIHFEIKCVAALPG